MDLRGSFFEGVIPKSLGNLQKLKFLGLSMKNLTNKIPGELQQLSSLETMIIGYNGFDGWISAEFGNLSSLKYPDMTIGNLSGKILADVVSDCVKRWFKDTLKEAKSRDVNMQALGRICITRASRMRSGRKEEEEEEEEDRK